jgi:hypothetical protein
MKKQKMKQRLLPTALISMSMANTPALADYTQDVEDALNFYHYGNNGAVKADVNYRYENVNQDKGPTFGPHKQFVETANANTARLRLGLLSPTFR